MDISFEEKIRMYSDTVTQYYERVIIRKQPLSQQDKAYLDRVVDELSENSDQFRRTDLYTTLGEILSQHYDFVNESETETDEKEYDDLSCENYRQELPPQKMERLMHLQRRLYCFDH